jgi:putative ubiquitin-RnfH superfamily antitoxin RatB of RatAB toxin-antitoxin module
MLNIEVVYATPEQQVIVTLKMAHGATIEHAIRESGLLTRFPALTQSALNVGIFARVCELQQPLAAGDRVEIYRALVHDPKEARRQRAKR